MGTDNLEGVMPIGPNETIIINVNIDHDESMTLHDDEREAVSLLAETFDVAAPSSGELDEAFMGRIGAVYARSEDFKGLNVQVLDRETMTLRPLGVAAEPSPCP